MNEKSNRIEAVPTNIITGFLGVGKTSAVLHLLKNKPVDERWAVLVNEFGEVGVDGSLVQGQSGKAEQVFIREVPGGCMCCAAGLPMQIALNQLLHEAKPDRLLIEPTGLGHPKEVLEVLSSEHYRTVLSLQKTLTLVDARKLSDTRYTNHETFNQQIAIADTVVGSKIDLYQADEKQLLNAYVEQVGRPETQVIFAASELPMPESGMIKAENEGEGFKSIGWRFAPDKVFDRQKLALLLLNLDVERMKAVFITNMGIFGYNLTSDGITEMELDDCAESRIELIAHKLDETIEQRLLACVTNV